MSDRTAFLDRLRERLAVPAPENLPHPLVHAEAVPPVEYALDLTDLADAFERAVSATGAHVLRGTAPEVLQSVLAATGAQRVVASKDAPAELGLPAYSGPVEAEQADLGVTGALYGIAATGTLVLHAGLAGGRTASLLPPVHLALLPVDRLLRDSGELFRKMGERLPDGLPSQLVFVSGPSRSADIELEVTVGVHGPRELWIGLVS